MAESKRQNGPAKDILDIRRAWGGRLLLELIAIGKDPIWLGAEVGYRLPGSMRQVINGHQGISLDVYKKILKLVPEMANVQPPPIWKETRGQGAPGPHKRHRYPKLGAGARSRPKSRGRKVATASNFKPKHESVARPTEEPLLSVRRFAQIEYATLPDRDLVVLVGPQATGKSLMLELLKLVMDRNRIVRSLRQHGFAWESPPAFSNLYFGGGFEKSWSSHTEVTFRKERVTLPNVSMARAYKGEDHVFYIPAHRTLAIADGWPRSFAQYQGVAPPYVARRFSELLLTSLNQGLVGKGNIFPHDRRLKDAFRTLIDKAIFHGATLKLEPLGMQKQFVLEYGPDATLPFMTWTAGQREFTPLLLGLYLLLPPGGPAKKAIQWAIIEEPEMGLHPKAIVAVMAMVLDLLARGYKVALSTHSPTVLEVVWGMSRLKKQKDGARALCKMLGLPDREIKVLQTATEALRRTYGVVYLEHDKSGRVISKDISPLDPGSADQEESGWGGLTGFSARVATVVAENAAKS